MTDREAPVKRYELEALASELKRDREQAAKDRQLDREQAAKDAKEIKELLKESNRITREAVAQTRSEFNAEIVEMKHDYVKEDKLKLAEQNMDSRVKNLEASKKTQAAWLKAGGGVILALLINNLWTLITNQARLP